MVSGTSSEPTLPDFVFDTSGFVNAWTKHYRLPVFQGVWDALGHAMDRSVIVSPSEVQVEIVRRADPDLPAWIAGHQAAFRPPEPSWNAHFGTIQAYAPHWFAGRARTMLTRSSWRWRWISELRS
jgi:hypothetical protein